MKDQNGNPVGTWEKNVHPTRKKQKINERKVCPSSKDPNLITGKDVEKFLNSETTHTPKKKAENEISGNQLTIASIIKV